MGLRRALQAFQHPHLAPAGLALTAGLVQLQGLLQLGLFLQLLADLEQQAAVAGAEVGVARCKVQQARQQAVERGTGVQLLTAVVQLPVVVQVLAAAEAAGLGADLDLLVAVDAQLGQDEFRPVLAQVAEEHQAQAVAQLGDLQAVQPILKGGTPGGKGLIGKILLHQLRAQLTFLLRPAPVGQRGVGQEFVLVQQVGPVTGGQHSLVGDPALGQERRDGRGDVADFRVVQLALPKVQALAHDQAHQQRLGRLGGAGEGLDKGLLPGAEQIGIALGHPGQRGAEVAEVIERGGESDGHDLRTVFAYRIV
jgi:hypothetical protein